MRKLTAATLVLTFSAPFFVVGACYASLPPELPIFGNPFAGAIALASKSAFTAFRVPLMNLAHGLMAAVMLSHAADFPNAQRRASYSAIFMTLLCAIAFKSNFEALGISILGWPRLHGLDGWLTAGAVISVVAGLGLAMARGRSAPLPWPELRLSLRDKALLMALFGAYLAIVVTSWLVSHRT
jgi:hypothetical protein